MDDESVADRPRHAAHQGLERSVDLLHKESREESASDRTESEALSVTCGRATFDEHKDVEHKGESGSEEDAGSESLHPIRLEAHCGKAVRDPLRERRTGPKGAPRDGNQEWDAGSQQSGAKVRSRGRLGAFRAEHGLRPRVEDLEDESEREEDHPEVHGKATPVGQFLRKDSGFRVVSRMLLPCTPWAGNVQHASL